MEASIRINKTVFIIITCHFQKPYCFGKHNSKILIHSKCECNIHVPPRRLVSAGKQFSSAARVPALPLDLYTHLNLVECVPSKAISITSLLWKGLDPSALPRKMLTK